MQAPERTTRQDVEFFLGLAGLAHVGTQGQVLEQLIVCQGRRGPRQLGHERVLANRHEPDPLPVAGPAAQTAARPVDVHRRRRRFEGKILGLRLLDLPRQYLLRPSRHSLGPPFLSPKKKTRAEQYK